MRQETDVQQLGEEKESIYKDQYGLHGITKEQQAFHYDSIYTSVVSSTSVSVVVAITTNKIMVRDYKDFWGMNY